MRAAPIITAIRFPKELSAMRKFSPLEALEEPKTAEKNKLAAIVPEFSRFSLPTSPNYMSQVVNRAQQL